jgi:hypothetical protein
VKTVVHFCLKENMSLDEWSQFLTLLGGFAYIYMHASTNENTDGGYVTLTRTVELLEQTTT